MKLIVIEAIGLHAGFLGCYGNEWIATPTLDSLACEGVVFDHHLADHPVLSNAIVSSARTGRYGFRPPRLDVSDGLATFQQRGWQVKCVAPSSVDEFASAVMAAIEGWQAEGNGLLWVDGPSLAPPWKLRTRILKAYFDGDEDTGPWPDPPQGIHESLDLEGWHRLRDTYAAVVTYFDGQLEKVIGALMERGWAEETLLCVTARSGLPLGEHGQVGEAEGPLHSERVHVPLILNLPGEEHKGTRVGALTQPVDLMPSLLGLMFGDRAENDYAERDGVSFLPLVRKEVGEVRTFAVAAHGKEAYLRAGEWALSLSPGSEEQASVGRLYRKPEDRWEVNDLRLRELERSEEMERQLRELVNPSELVRDGYSLATEGTESTEGGG